jgi:hypothetical protein
MNLKHVRRQRLLQHLKRLGHESSHKLPLAAKLNAPAEYSLLFEGLYSEFPQPFLHLESHLASFLLASP